MAFGLLTPADASTGVSLTPTLTWEDNGGGNYTVTWARDDALTDVIGSDLTTNTSYSIATPLPAGTVVWWGVFSDFTFEQSTPISQSFTTIPGTVAFRSRDFRARSWGVR